VARRVFADRMFMYAGGPFKHIMTVTGIQLFPAISIISEIDVDM
jgi:hypothetical protein